MLTNDRFENFDKILAQFKIDLLDENELDSITERLSAVIDQVLFVEMSDVVRNDDSLVHIVQVARLTNATYNLDEVASAIDIASSHTYFFTDITSALNFIAKLVSVIK